MQKTAGVGAEDLKMIHDSEGPCISIFQPVPFTPKAQRPVRLKRAIESVEQILRRRAVDPSQEKQLLEPLYEWEPGSSEETGKGLVIFRSPRIFQRFFVSQPLDEMITVADHFYILPLLPIADSGRIFYILALSQKHIRLLLCAPDSTEEVPLPNWVPRTLDDSAQTDKPDHMLDNRSFAGPSVGAMKGVMFGTLSDRDAKDQYLLHFYKEVDEGLNKLLKNGDAPVVLAGVEYELALYRKVSRYPRLAPNGVHGSPDGLKGGELRKRAEEIANAVFAEPLEQALQAYENLGPERRSSELTQVVKAAYEGRVAHLFIEEGAKEMGRVDRLSLTVEHHPDPRPGDEDLVNAAAVETMLHGGLVDILPPEKAPARVVAALLRY
jgi:hypothetical protein